MKRLGRLVQLAGLNAIPLAGVSLRGWSDGTALALYWCEGLVAVVLVAIRITIHRRMTNKRGHYLSKTAVSESAKKTAVSTSAGTRRGKHSSPTEIRHYGTQFLAMAFFLAFAPLTVAAKGVPEFDAHEVWGGLGLSSLFLAVGFVMDLPTIRDQPFAWVRNIAAAASWRLMLVGLAVVVGAVGTGFDYPKAGAIVFVALKLYTDLVGSGQYDPRQPPGLLARHAGGPLGQYLKENWTADHDARHRQWARDEEPFDGRPSEPPAYASEEALPPDTRRP